MVGFSFVVASVLVTPGVSDSLNDPSCAANPKCSGLAGNCCPTSSGVVLGCCDSPAPPPPVPVPTPSPAPVPVPTPSPAPVPVPTPSPSPPPSCGDAPPGKPTGAFDLNGVAWPAMCINKTEAHFFGIGDWGGDGLNGHTWENPGKFNQRGGKVAGPDDYGQQYVARQMKALAVSADPDFIVNAGDNFYPGGYDMRCGPQNANAGADPNGQFGNVFYSQYSGPGLDGKPWLSVLGNHDYGGRSFEEGWDLQIFHTWHSDTWRMPGQFWSQNVKYNGFSVDFFMLESNFLDTFPIGAEPNHNICQDWYHTNQECWGINLNNCCQSFQASWHASLDMLEDSLSKSTADWKIINTHFPGPSIAGQRRIQEMNSKYGIDLIFTGHTHYQTHGEEHNIPWIISGGGGGVSSDAKPSLSGHDTAYGFVDFTINKDTLKFDMHSWGGVDSDGSPIIMSTKTLSKRGVHGASADQMILV